MVSRAFELSRFGDSDTINVDSANSTVNLYGSALSPVQSFKNKIINGNFDIWQRGTTGTSGYVADRWSNPVLGSTAAISRQSFTLGQTDVPNEPTYFHRVVVTSVAGAGNYCVPGQFVESVRTLAGQTATLSFWAKADASKNIAIEGNQYFGTGGSPSTQVNGIDVTTCALTTSWQKFTVTFNFPSISGKTLGTDNNDSLRIFFWLDAGSNWDARTNSLGQQSGTFDIAQVQLEAGSVATPFEMRPIGTELALCQRYYEENTMDFRTLASGAGNFVINCQFAATKRATPTLAFSAAASASLNVSGTPTLSSTNSSAATVRMAVASAGSGDTFYVRTFTADAEI